MKINVTTDELVSIFFIYLLDKINNPEEIYPQDESFDELLERIEKLKPQLTKFYLNSDINNRIYYKRIREAFEKENFSKSYVINIIDKSLVESQNINENEETKKENTNFFEIKEIVKKTIKKIKKFKFRKSSILKEDDLEKLIEKSIFEHFKNIEDVKNKEE